MSALTRYLPCSVASEVLAWPARRLGVAALAAAATVLAVGLPTALVRNPVFGRDVAPASWAWPSLLVTALLAGLLIATYVRDPAEAPTAGAEPVGEAPAPGEATVGEATLPGAAPVTRAEPTGAREGRAALGGGVLGILAVGCPVCNKLALLALGYTGALRWFAPVQPVLAVAGIALLWYALGRRLGAQSACALPGRAAAGPTPLVSVVAAPRPASGPAGAAASSDEDTRPGQPPSA